MAVVTGVGAGLRGALLVCGTGSDTGKSFVVAGLCRLLARRGVKVAPFKAQNMALNASVTGDGAEIGHAQWIQALAAGVEPEATMNPILLKPTGDRTSQVVVLGRPTGVVSASGYQDVKPNLWPVVLDALADLRARFDVVICEGAGSPAEINLLDRDVVNLPLAAAAGVPAIVVGDIDRGGVFASLYGTVALVPEGLRRQIRGFVVNRLRGDPALLGGACAELERRCGVPTLGVIPAIGGADLDAEDSLALDRPAPEPPPAPLVDGDTLDVAALRWPRVSNAGDLDPLRLEPAVHVRWVRSVAEFGRPDLVVLPGSKATRHDLAWFRRTGLADTVQGSSAAVTAVCAGLQMIGRRIHDPDGVEGPPGSDDGLGWLPVTTRFADDKVLDRPSGRVASGPGSLVGAHGAIVGGYRIHHGRVDAGGMAEGAEPWLVGDDGTILGWHAGRVCGTTLHGLFEADGFRAGVLAWVAAAAGKRWMPSDVSFAAARVARLERMADAIEAHVQLDRLAELIAEGAP